jgi:hypothetical protein
MAFISNGTTILDAGAFQASLGNLVLISEQTASASASISFTTGIDSTYPIYKFEFINIHPATNGTFFQFNMSTDGGSNYNVTKTTSSFYAYHTENNVTAVLEYWSDGDLAQSTSDSRLSYETKNDSDAHVSGTLQIFNPSSTTFVKHFISRNINYWQNDGNFDQYIAGYGNTTSAVDAIKFQMSSGNIDSGTIKLYGIKDS